MTLGTNARISLVALLVLLSTSWVQAWSREGHQVVALLAWERLTERTRLAITEILGHHPDEEVRDLTAASFWPDLLRDDPVHHRPGWHYTNIPHFLGLPPKPVEVPQGILWALNHNTRILKDVHAPKAERAVALSWVTHLIGDLHQPLHTSNTYSPLFPEGDRGGNLYRVLWSGREVDLHHFWDRAGGLFQGPEGRPSLDELQVITKKLHAAELQQPNAEGIRDPQIWTDESFAEVVNTVYVGVSPLGELSAEYVENAQRLSRERLILAGRRLGDYLNRVFD